MGLFDDLHLHHVNPFDETFRRAVETKSLDDFSSVGPVKEVLAASMATEDSLHTPRVLPLSENHLNNGAKQKLSNLVEDRQPNEAKAVRVKHNSPNRKSSERSSRLKKSAIVRRVLPKGCNPNEQVIQLFGLPQIIRISENSASNVNPIFLQKATDASNICSNIPRPVESMPTNSVREKLKAQILSGGLSKTIERIKPKVIETQSKAASTNKGVIPTNMPVAAKPVPVKRKATTVTKNEEQLRFERNREAARRYR